MGFPYYRHRVLPLLLKFETVQRRFFQSWQLPHQLDLRRSFLWMLGAGICLAFFLFATEKWDLDLTLEHYFFDTSNGLWLVEKEDTLPRLFFYYGTKYAVAAFGVFLIVLLVKRYWTKHSTPNPQALFFVITCLALVPSLTAWFKYLTGVPCPYQLQLFGGTFHYYGLFDFHWPDGSKHPACFPAGHPSGGFALLCLPLVTPYKKMATAFAVLLGTVMSAYQIARGAHFLSHCVTTALLSIVLIHSIYLLFYFIPALYRHTRTPKPLLACNSVKETV